MQRLRPDVEPRIATSRATPNETLAQVWPSKNVSPSLSTAPISTRPPNPSASTSIIRRLLKEFQSKGRLIRAFYYTALVEDQEYSSIRPLIDWLDYNGYAVVTKPTKEFVDSIGRRKVKGNMDIELAVDAMEMADHIDHMVLFSGDGDFRSLVEAVQRKGVRVSVVSTVTTQPPMVADELRRQADEFIDLVHLVAKVGRDADRPERAPRQQRAPPLRADCGHGSRRRRSAGAVTLGVTVARSRRSGRPNRRPIARSARASSPSATEPPAARCRLAQRARALLRRRVARAADRRVWRRACTGANRTGRPFTGDWAGDLLYETLADFGFAAGTYDERPDDGLVLVDCLVTNAVRCVPPGEQADAGGDRDLPHLPDRPRSTALPRLTAPSWRSAGSRTRAWCARCGARLSAFRSATGASTSRVATARQRRALRQLSLLALQHEHRRADARDVPGGVRAGPRLSGVTAGSGRPNQPDTTRPASSRPLSL